MPRYCFKSISSLSVGASCALLGISLCAQTADPQSSQPPTSQPTTSQPTTAQPAQPPTGSRAQTIRQMLQAEAARRAAANAEAQGQTPAVPVPAPAAPVPTQAVSASPDPAQSTAPQAVPTAGVNQPALATTPAAPPAVTSAQPPAAVKSVKIVHDKVAGTAIEIVTSRPVPPALQTLSNPPRLVIDLPNANVAVKQKDLTPKGDQFTDLHVYQFQISPPVTRVTVDLAEARQYTWDGAGNRLTIRVKPPEDPKAKATPPPPAQPDTVSKFGSVAQPAVVPVAACVPAG